jgi:Flp pilus assembly protein TadD
VLLVAGAVAYANGLEGPFIYDDATAIVDNESLRHLWPPGRVLRSPPSTPLAGRPVVALTLAVNYALGGLDVRGYHALNIAVHIGCALLLAGIIRRTLLTSPLREHFGRASGGLALACALVWMTHPLQTECVSYVTQRTESMMGLFYLLTLYFAIRALGSAHARWWCAASVLSCGLGMASKEVMVTAPVMVVLYDWSFRSEPFRDVLARRFGLYAGLAATWVVLAALVAPGPRAETVGFGHGVTAASYALNQCVMIVHYLRLAFWPHPLVLDYGFPRSLTIAEAAPYAVVVAGLLVTTAVALAYRPALGFPWTWLFVILAPTSSVVPIATEVAAERRMYLPVAGLIVFAIVTGYRLLEAAAERLPRRRPTGAALKRSLGPVALLVAVVPLVWATRQRNALYADPVAIWQTAVQAVPQNHRARTNLGIALADRQRLDDAIEQLRLALVIKPDSARAHYNLGNALAARGRVDEAMAHYRATLKVKPDAAEAHHNLGLALAREGRLREAIHHFQSALAIKPADAEAHHNLGKALAMTGRPREALSHLRRAGNLAPQWPDPLRDAAWILATYPEPGSRNGAEAVALAERAAALATNDARILDTLAAACAEDGDFTRAVRFARRAMSLALGGGDEPLAARIRARLDLYEHERPYRAGPEPPDVESPPSRRP